MYCAALYLKKKPPPADLPERWHKAEIWRYLQRWLFSKRQLGENRTGSENLLWLGLWSAEGEDSKGGYQKRQRQTDKTVYTRKGAIIAAES